ncbi:MAG: hypothetical protein NPIRA04_31860 [Nitrospirales bacterium]|nr:MAG: hypothetical protein NPIRA04_31860 [Nitrospirales bacterium]
MKQQLFFCSLMVVFMTGICAPGLAGQYDEFIQFVNHRDQHGALVVPPHSDASGGEEGSMSQAQVTSHMEQSSESTTPSYSNGESPEVMKKTVLPSLPGTYMFRSTNWGMSISDVKDKETAKFLWELDSRPLSPGEHRLGYQARISDIDTVLTYAFENDRLINAKYIFDPNEGKNDAQPLWSYKKVKSWISQTYGLPQSEEKLWSNELYRYAPELWGRAVMRGHLTIVDEWNVDGTSIILLLNGGDESVGLIAEFSNTAYASKTELVHLPPSFFAM